MVRWRFCSVGPVCAIRKRVFFWGNTNCLRRANTHFNRVRSLLRRPSIIIFDEATSALDPESEAVVVNNLKQMAKGRTTIVISHRLQTIRDADTIIVLDNGAVNDLGTHNQLLDRNFVYRQLWSQQHARPA